jgi:hypothetical protein
MALELGLGTDINPCLGGGVPWGTRGAPPGDFTRPPAADRAASAGAQPLPRDAALMTSCARQPPRFVKSLAASAPPGTLRPHSVA